MVKNIPRGGVAVKKADKKELTKEIEALRAELERRKNDTLICIGNHEQYFFSDYFIKFI